MVAERECGTCTACCTDLLISEPGFDKPAGIPCPNCIQAKGCSIYATRPPVCRTYHCAWQKLPAIDDSWRPDRSGILINPVAAPAAHTGTAANLILIGNPQILREDRFVNLAANFIESGTATALVIPQGPGLQACEASLNAILAPALAARSLPAARHAIWTHYEHMLAQPPVPIPEGPTANAHQQPG